MADTRERPGFMLYTEDARIWDEFLTDAELAQLFRAVVRYVDKGTEPDDLPKHVFILYRTMRGKIERDRRKYDAMCERRQQAAITREAKKKVRESQSENAKNIDNTKKNEDTESTTVQNCHNSAELSQQALTVTETVTLTETETYPKPKTTTTNIPEQLTTLWQTLWSASPTYNETAAFEKMVNEGNELEDIQQAMREAHQKADENPIGYMFALLKAWKVHGKPHRPTESRDILQRRSLEERREAYEAAIVNLYEDE